jgi:hypothetical protein
MTRFERSAHSILKLSIIVEYDSMNQWFSNCQTVAHAKCFRGAGKKCVMTNCIVLILLKDIHGKWMNLLYLFVLKYVAI